MGGCSPVIASHSTELAMVTKQRLVRCWSHMSGPYSSS